MGWHTDANGVPVLSADDIEQIADDFLERFDSKCLESPKPINFRKVIALLREKYNVSFVFNESLGKDKNGNRYAGYYNVNTRSIYIDVSLAFKRKQWAFVLAHEIGHFILHSNNNFPDSNLSQYNKLDTMRTLALYKFDKDNPYTWREWQANKFASCILISRFTIRDELIRLQKLIGINRSLGKIYLDHQGINKRDFHTLTSHLSRVYSVSRTVVKLRLKALDLLTETTFTKPSNILLDVLENLGIQG